jgi:hypothetical protein
MLYVVASSGEAWRRDSHNQVDVGAIVVLKNGRDVDHFPLRICLHNFQVLPLFETTGFESLEETIHAIVVTHTTRVVHNRSFEFPAACARIGGDSRSSMSEVGNQQDRREEGDQRKTYR